MDELIKLLGIYSTKRDIFGSFNETFLLTFFFKDFYFTCFHIWTIFKPFSHFEYLLYRQ